MTQQTGAREEIFRADDDELLGFVTAADDGTYTATTLFGGLLGTHPDADAAENQVRDIGLSSLAERWWIYTDEQWQQCWLIEASPERLVAVVALYPFMGDKQVFAPGTPLQLAAPTEIS